MKSKVFGNVVMFCAIGAIVLTSVSGCSRKKEDISGENTEATTETIEITTSEFAEEIPVGLSDVALMDDVKEEVQQLYEKINEYYIKNRTKKQLITAYGMLYNAEKKTTVTATDLKSEGIIDGEEDVLNNLDILLLAPKDVQQYCSGVDSGSSELEIFLGFNSKDGYYVVNDSYEPFILEPKPYADMVMSYSYTNGAVRNPVKGDNDYTDILSVIPFDEEYDVKHIACDNKYAVVVLGGLRNTTMIKEYVLTKEAGGWEVAVDGVEAMTDVKVNINSLYPKMEIGLLPEYEISSYGQIQNNFESYVQSLIQLKMISNSDLPVTYSCGARGFAYMECGDKKLLGCVNEKQQIEFYEVKNYTEAIAYMMEFSDNPPVFILKYDN